MSVSFTQGQGNLICDGIDAGPVEFSIASPNDGPDLTRRGKVWGNKPAIAAAMDASQVRLTSSGDGETYPLEIDDLDRDGGAMFTIMTTA